MMGLFLIQCFFGVALSSVGWDMSQADSPITGVMLCFFGLILLLKAATSVIRFLGDIGSQL